MKTVVCVLLLASVALAVVPMDVAFENWATDAPLTSRPQLTREALKQKPIVDPASASFKPLDHGNDDNQGDDNHGGDNGHDCHAAGYPPSFPFCPPAGQTCPAFGTRSWTDIDGYTRIGNIYGRPPADHPEQIYSSWPQPFLGCLQAYCVPGNTDPICHYITAARGARSAIQIGVVRQMYENVVCNSATDCTPWNILLSPTLATPGNVFSPNVQMRINPLGFFPVYPVVVGYFYALGQPPPNTPTAGKNRVSHIFHTSPDVAYNNRVCGHVDIYSSQFDTGLNGKNFTHYYCFSFDANNQIAYGEISFRHLGTLSDVPDCVPGLATTIANSLCPTIQRNCVGANQQYASVADCVAYVGSLPTATWDKANQANTPCVSLHLLLTFMAPDIHCPHVGPTGGGFCTNAHTYTWDFTAVPSDLMAFADPSY